MNMKKKIRMLAALLALSACILSGCTRQRMMMGTGGTSGTYYAFGGILAQYMENYTDYSVTAVSTSGSKANIQSIEDNDFQMGFTQSDVMSYAWEGSRSFQKDGRCRDFRVLGALYSESVQLITMREDIKSVSDLKGKSVSIGAPGSGVYFNAMDVLEGAGLTTDDINLQYQSFDDSKEALKDGQIDAAFVVAGAPTSAITELATTNGVCLVPIDGALRANMLRECPFYKPVVIEAETYPEQEEAIDTIAIKTMLIVDSDLDDDVVYDLTAAVFEHMDGISKEHKMGEELSIENAASEVPVPFHAGAARYYAEHGVNVAIQE